MASRGQDFSASGQGQLRKDETNQSSHPSQQSRSPHHDLQSGQDQSYTTQATNFLQQTGEQVKNMAQGAAEAVKNTLGMSTENSPNQSSNPTNSPTNNPTNSPTNLSHGGSTNPSHRI